MATKTAPQPVMASLQTVAAQYGVSTDWLRDNIAAGRLPAYRGAGKGSQRTIIRVRLEDVEALFTKVA